MIGSPIYLNLFVRYIITQVNNDCQIIFYKFMDNFSDFKHYIPKTRLKIDTIH